VLQTLQQHLSAFDHIHTTTCLYALAKHRRTLPDAAAGSRSVASLMKRQSLYLESDRLDGRQLANTLWAAATLSEKLHLPLTMLDAATARVARRVNRLSHLDVANTLWSLATLRSVVQDAHLHTVRALACCNAMEDPKGFQPQGLSNCLWALAILSVPDLETTAESLLETAATRQTELDDQHVANILWSVATMGVPGHQGAIRALTEEAAKRSATLKTQELASSCWALASLAPNEATEPTMLELASATNEKAKELKDLELVNILWSFATVGDRQGWTVKQGS